MYKEYFLAHMLKLFCMYYGLRSSFKLLPCHSCLLMMKGVVMGEKRLPLEPVACFQLSNPMVVNALSGLLLPMLDDPNKRHT